MTRWFIAALLVACGAAPQSEPGSEPESGSESESPSRSASARVAECTTARDCTLLRAGCGNRTGAPNGTPQPELRPRTCMPNDNPPREPVCRHGQCQTQQAPHPELRECQADRDCVVADAFCDTWLAVHRDHVATFEAEERRRESTVDCMVSERPANLRAVCLLSLCVLR